MGDHRVKLLFFSAVLLRKTLVKSQLSLTFKYLFDYIKVNILVIIHFPSFWVQSSPKSNFPEEKPIFPHQNFHQNRHSLFSSIFRPTEKINRNCTIYYDKYYFCIFKMFEIREFYFTRGKFWLVNFIQKMGELVVNHSGR